MHTSSYSPIPTQHSLPSHRKGVDETNFILGLGQEVESNQPTPAFVIRSSKAAEGCVGASTARIGLRAALSKVEWPYEARGNTLCGAVGCCMYTSETQRVFPSCLTWSQKSSTLDYAVLRNIQYHIHSSGSPTVIKVLYSLLEGLRMLFCTTSHPSTRVMYFCFSHQSLSIHLSQSDWNWGQKQWRCSIASPAQRVVMYHQHRCHSHAVSGLITQSLPSRLVLIDKMEDTAIKLGIHEYHDRTNENMQHTKASCSFCAQSIPRQVKNFQGRHHSNGHSKVCCIIGPDAAFLQH